MCPTGGQRHQNLWPNNILFPHTLPFTDFEGFFFSIYLLILFSAYLCSQVSPCLHPGSNSHHYWWCEELFIPTHHCPGISLRLSHHNCWQPRWANPPGPVRNWCPRLEICLLLGHGNMCTVLLAIWGDCIDLPILYEELICPCNMCMVILSLWYV